MYRFWQIEEKKVILPHGGEEVYTLLKLNHPPLNVLSKDVLWELSGVIEVLQNKTRVVVLTGEGKAFAAGADIAEMSNMDENQAKEFSFLGQLVFEKLEKSSFISIAAIRGAALGGGLELALACDIRVVCEDALLGLPESTLGLIPGFGGTVRLVRLLPYGSSLYLTLTGERFNGKRAYELQLAQKLVTQESLLEECEKLATLLLRNGPEALKAIKELYLKTKAPFFEAHLKEEEYFSQLFAHGQAQEGLRAFLEKRPARFKP